MVKVVPFKAFRYDENKVGDISKAVAPPYDVMKGKKLDTIQGLSNSNIAWVTKNKPKTDDTQTNNQYTRAKEILNNMITQGILRRDEKECFYIYGQDFNVHGNDYFRYGFIGLMELEDFADDDMKKSSGINNFKGVLQHEETLPKDIEDRLNLSRETLAQFGQIFVIYPDHKKEVDNILEKNMKNKPLVDIYDDQNVRHRLWAVDRDEDKIDISRVMENKYVIIADGHHRYKTALALRKERKDLIGSNYRMLTFVNTVNTGLVILPTHRLVQNLENFNKNELIEKLESEFQIEKYQEKERMFSDMNGSFESGKKAFGMFMDDGNYYSLTLKDDERMNKMLPDKSEELRKLDVSVLHSLILDKILGIDKKKLQQGTMTGGGYVIYIKGIGDAVEEAISEVKNKAQVVFFMNPTRIEEVEGVATNFECMPQKSTFFYPKVWTGFAINKIE